MSRKPKLGDVFEIPLSGDRRGYGQFVYYDEKKGPIIQVYRLISEGNLPIDEIIQSGPMFPPVITGLFAAIRQNLWKVIGNRPVDDFVYQPFVSTMYNGKTGKAGKWFLWDGEEYLEIGEKLPDSLKNQEFLVVWSPFDIVNRIETGEIPYPYKELIQFNAFTPMV